ERLAADIARFPQTCLRGDRASLLDQEGLPLDAAMEAEFGYGVRALGEAAEGAARFAGGAGRHGDFTDL
ncbi:enoyl-CoA hydratase, partial [Streptomyces varsoviensis]